MEHKAGFVNIIGNPNVGKSTLMNALIGHKLSIITNKAQTTRHRILGILNEKKSQIVFSDRSLRSQKIIYQIKPRLLSRKVDSLSLFGRSSNRIVQRSGQEAIQKFLK